MSLILKGTQEEKRLVSDYPKVIEAVISIIEQNFNSKPPSLDDHNWVIKMADFQARKNFTDNVKKLLTEEEG